MAIIDRNNVVLSAANPPVSNTPNADLAIKTAVLVATTGSNIVLSGVQVIDGVTVGNASERVLVKDQTDQTTNGIYTASTGNWTRTVDANNQSQWASGQWVTITAGAANALVTFVCTAANPITLGTTAITYQGRNNTLTNPVFQGNITLQTATGAAFGSLSTSTPSALVFQGAGAGQTTSIQLNPGAVANATVISEVVQGLSTYQPAIGSGNGTQYGRWSLGFLGSSGGNLAGIFAEWGGPAPAPGFIFQTAYENPPGTVVSIEYFRIQPNASIAGEDNPFGATLFGVPQTVPINVICLDIANIGAAGTRDSHAILQEGKANNGVTEKPAWWRYRVNVTSQAGASQFIWQQNLNGGGWTTRMTLTDAGILTLPINGIGVTSTDGYVLSNTTAAAAGAQQWSPRLHWIGQGWKTASSAASQTVDWIAENQTVQGSSNPTGNLVFSSQVNAGGYTANVAFTSAGFVGIGTTTPNYLLQLNGASASFMQITNPTTGTGSTNGVFFGLSASSTTFKISNESTAADGGIWFIVNAAAVGALAISKAGNVGIGSNYTPGTVDSSFSLGFNGQAAQTIGMERETTSNTAGFGLTISAGGATSGATNKAGGTLLLSGGVSTGSGVGEVALQSYPGSAGSTSDNTVQEVLRALGAGNIKFSNAASWSANGSVATALSSVGPTGSHTTVQEWLTVVDSGGTTRYIPCF